MQQTRQFPLHRNTIGAASVCLLLAACGGGGGDSSDNNVTPPPVANQPAAIDVASVTKAIPDISTVIPVCRKTTGSAADVAPKSTRDAANSLWLVRLLAARELTGGRSGPALKALGSAKPADVLGDCGGRRGYPSYSHLNGVTTATLTFDNYCSTDSSTGNRQVINGSIAFVNTGTPTPSGPVTTRIEANSPAGVTLQTRDSTGKVLTSQSASFSNFLSVIGVPGGIPTAASPDTYQFAEIQYTSQARNTYRETNYKLTRYETANGGESMSLSGRGYRSDGSYFDLSTTVPVTSDSSGKTTAGELTMSGANGAKAVMTMVPGSTLQATMTVNGTAVTAVPACK
ncbi:MAG: hypothetical protein KAY46_09360 [Burkholderiaceae bacterium]|nr:hypothetical protein [Burkholderiaceae bacterium]